MMDCRPQIGNCPAPPIGSINFPRVSSLRISYGSTSGLNPGARLMSSSSAVERADDVHPPAGNETTSTDWRDRSRSNDV